MQSNDIAASIEKLNAHRKQLTEYSLVRHT